jgi:peptidoglycan DL-endopeptidase CwlS
VKRPLRRIGVFLAAILILQLVGLTVVSAAPAAQAPMLGMPIGMPAPTYHVVRPGETLFSIGRLYGISPWQIAQTNMIPNPSLIFIGQVLYIIVGPGPMPPGPMPPGPFPPGPLPPGPSPIGPWPGGGCTSFHAVRYGETLFSIGRLYGINPWSIARVNCLINPNIIFAGQVLCLPAPEPMPYVL